VLTLNIRADKSDEASRDDEVLCKSDVRTAVICVFYSITEERQ
jgi:hypothetical protein